MTNGSHDDAPDLVDELIADGDADHELVAKIADALAPASTAATGDIRRRLLERVQQGGRLHRFASEVAEILDIDEDKAKALLDGIDKPANWEGSPLPDVGLYHLEGGEKVQGAITGFIRIDNCGVFPEHDHSGAETVLIVQGRCRDTSMDRILKPGDIALMSPKDGFHEVTALPGPPLVYLAVVFEGITIDGKLYTAEEI